MQKVYTGVKPIQVEYLPGKELRRPLWWRSFVPAPGKQPIFLQIGTRIHIHSRNGQYTVKALTWDTVRLTTNKWQKEHESGQRAFDYVDVPLSDIKCRVGYTQHR